MLQKTRQRIEAATARFMLEMNALTSVSWVMPNHWAAQRIHTIRW